MILFCTIFLLIYILAIVMLIFGFFKIREFKFQQIAPKTKFSIVVPFRNEAENLPKLLESFSKLDYPVDLFEVILMDDDSDDGFKTGNFDFPLSVLANHRHTASPKKDAIKTAIASAKHDWIITTDADCIVPEKWLSAFDTFIKHGDAKMIVGAVRYESGRSFLDEFQQMEFASLQATTIGSFGLRMPFMCNGANFAYTKTLFHELKGFDGNDTIAGGDDVFLLQKAVAAFPGKVKYLKLEEAIVTTKTAENWKILFYQRVRWAAKAGSYKSWLAKILGLVVFCGNLAFIFTVFTLLFQYFSLSLLLLVLGKIIADLILIFSGNDFLKNKTRCFILGSFLYPVFSVAVALYSVFGKYEWKGRTFRK